MEGKKTGQPTFFAIPPLAQAKEASISLHTAAFRRSLLLPGLREQVTGCWRRAMASEVSLSSGTANNQGGEEETRLQLLPGFRFLPTDEEVITHYLAHKVLNSIFSIADVDLNKIEPWDLPSKAKMGENDWYFFSLKDRKYPTGMRTNRATASGYWEATGKDKEIFRGHRVLLGMKKTLVSYKGREPIEHQTGGDVSTGDMRIAADDGRLGKGDQDEPGQFRIIIPPARRRLLLELCKSQWDPADDDGFNMATPKEEDPLHCSLRAPRPSVRFPTSDALHSKVPWDTEVLSIVGNVLWYTRQLAVNKIMTGNLIQRHDKINHEADINGNIKILTEVEIERITRNFSTLIGKGGFGEVYRGILDDDNEPVAVKKYINEDLRQVFVEEIRARKISHKNVVKGYCIGEHTLMIVMEYMSKGNLNDILHHSEISIPLDVRLGIAIGCAEALSYMHSMHLSSGNLVCHGDVKPANILLDDNLTAKLTDFGVSRLLVGGITRYTTTTKGSIEYMDPIYIQEGCPTRLEIARDMASALVFLHSSLDRHSIVHLDLKADNILLDEKVEPMISDFGLSRVLHADDYTHIRTGRAVHAHNGPLDAKFSGKPSAKRGIETSIVSHVNRRPRYLSVHHHPFTQILPSARKWITSKRTFGDIFMGGISAKPKYESFGDIFKGWISDKPKYETPIVGPVSEYIIRKLFGIKNGLTVNGSQQHSDPDYSRPDHGKMAVNTQTSASWIIATAAPHHATGNRNLLSGFIMEHDDQFVDAVNRVPMKVLARGAVVTDALILPDVWFVPGLTENLVSVSQLAELDHSIGFGRGECCIRSARDAKIVGKGRLQKGGHYVLDYLKVPLAI